jgi:hypothetical protein
MKKHWLKHLGLCMLLLAGLSAHTVLMAQSDPDGKSPATFTYAIKNATVVQAPGKVLNGATVIVKDGLISAVGPNVQVPVGAYEIDGQGMFVYPGFIDGLSQAAVKRPENPERPRDLQPSMPPNNIAGITPELRVKDYLEPGAKALDDMRKAGFTAGHVVPNGRMLPGSSSFILFGSHSEADQLILKNDVGMFAQLQGAQGVYPSTVIAVMSKWRELYKNAQLAQENDRVFASNSAGINRPVRDRVLEAFYPVINKQQPVFFHAPNQLDVRRVLSLQKDTGFNLVLVNVKQGWGMENEIKAAGGKVLLSLDLPEEKKATENAADEAKAREDRRTDAYKQHVSLAADYEKAGIKFGFAGVATSPTNIKKNLKTMIDNGLSENAALAALTTTPAEMFGVAGMMGTVDAGKIANLFISTGNYFDKDSEVKYVFVDGKLTEYESRPARSANNSAGNGGAAAANIVGKWSYTMESPMGATDGEMTFERAEDEYKGSMTFGMGGTNSTLDMRDIRVEGSNLRFSVMIEMGGQSITLRANGTVEGDNFSGSIDTGNFGSFAVKGARIGQQSK